MRWTMLGVFIVTVPAFVGAVAWWSRRHDGAPAAPDARDAAAPRVAAPGVAAPDAAYAAPLARAARR